MPYVYYAIITSAYEIITMRRSTRDRAMEFLVSNHLDDLHKRTFYLKILSPTNWRYRVIIVK